MRCVNRLRKCSDIHIKYILKNTNFYNWRRVQESKLYCEFEKCVTTIHCKHTGSFTCMYFLQILAINIIIIRFSITRLCCCSEGRKKLQPPKIFRVNGRILYPNVFIHIIFNMWMRVNAPYVFLLSLMCAWPLRLSTTITSVLELQTDNYLQPGHMRYWRHMNLQ